MADQSWIAPRVWGDLTFLEYENDPFAPPPRQPKKKKEEPPVVPPVPKKVEESSKQQPPLKQPLLEEKEIDYDELLGTMPIKKEETAIVNSAAPVVQHHQEQQEVLLSLPKISMVADSDLDDDLDGAAATAVPFNQQEVKEQVPEKKLEYSSSDDDLEEPPVGSSTGAATTITSYVFHHEPKKEESFDLFERLDRQVRRAFFDLFHEDVHVLPKHEQLQNAKDDFERLVDL